MVKAFSEIAGPVMPSPAQIANLPPSLQKLIQALSQSKTFTPGQVKVMLEKASISARDLIAWANFSHSVTESYGRKLVFHGQYFEIMVMSWAPGDYSAIHDHGNAQWGAVQCFDRADHYVYAYKKGILTTLNPAHYTPGMIHEVDQGLIHQMGNPGDTPFLSLHVYGCTDNRQLVTGDARIFDLLEKQIYYTDGGVFFGLPDAQIKRRRLGLRGDGETTLRHHQHMRDRLQRILASQPSSQLEAKLAQLNQEILWLKP